MKTFNTEAICTPEENYMVDLADKVKEISKLIDQKKYFTINRARQYGKTTTLTALERYLSDKYDVIMLDFQDVTDAIFANENEFARGLSRVICDTKDTIDIPLSDDIYQQFMELANEDGKLVLNDLFRVFDKWCKENSKPVVLIIDEVDSATNNQVFLDFLGKFRSNYLKRKKQPKYKTFQSVILAGVTDVKHLKIKIRGDAEEKENSPWNIAADFTIDMSLSADGIKGMLDEYEADHHTGMDTENIAAQIHEYTNGYPFLVSRICELLDTEVSKSRPQPKAWTRDGIDEAVKLILAENNTLFQSLTKNLNNYPDLKEAIRSILMQGTRLTWNAQQDSIAQMQMYGLIRNDHNVVRVSNRIFETMLYNLFLSDEELKQNVFSKEGGLAKNQFVIDGKGDGIKESRSWGKGAV